MESVSRGRCAGWRQGGAIGRSRELRGEGEPANGGTCVLIGVEHVPFE